MDRDRQIQSGRMVLVGSHQGSYSYKSKGIKLFIKGCRVDQFKIYEEVIHIFWSLVSVPLKWIFFISE